MNLLYVIDSLFPAGAERSLAALAPHYRDAGVLLNVAYLKNRPGVQSELRTAGAKLFNLEGSAGRMGWVRRLVRLAGELRPELIHTTLFESDIAGRVTSALTRIPVVSSLVNEAYGPAQMMNPGLKSWKVRGAQISDAITSRRVVRFHSISETVARVMSSRLHIPEDRIEVIPRGRDPEELGIRSDDRRIRVRTQLGIEGDTPMLLAAGRHEYQKGLDTLLEAHSILVKKIPNARLFIAGREGNHTSKLRQTAMTSGLNGSVSFLGERSDVPDLMVAADLFTLPSRWEGFAGVLLEAMALESPIVASDLPVLREVTAGTARLVHPESPEKLASAILEELKDRSRALDRARQGRHRFLSLFTSQAVARRMVRFYETALSQVRDVA